MLEQILPFRGQIIKKFDGLIARLESVVGDEKVDTYELETVKRLRHEVLQVDTYLFVDSEGLNKIGIDSSAVDSWRAELQGALSHLSDVDSLTSTEIQLKAAVGKPAVYWQR